MTVTKEDLFNYLLLEMEIENILEQLERLKSMELIQTRRESIGEKHRQSIYSPMENAVIRRIEYQKRIKKRLEEIYLEQEKCENAVSRVSDPLERSVLELRYLYSIDGRRRHKWNEIAVKVYGNDDEKEIRAVHRIHKRALLSVAGCE